MYVIVDDLRAATLKGISAHIICGAFPTLPRGPSDGLIVEVIEMVEVDSVQGSKVWKKSSRSSRV